MRKYTVIFFFQADLHGSGSFSTKYLPFCNDINITKLSYCVKEDKNEALHKHVDFLGVVLRK